MVRVVVDTNVVVSALLAPGRNEGYVLQLIGARRLAPCYSAAVIDEYERVLGRPKFRFPEEVIGGVLALFRANGERHEPTMVPQVSPDPSDNVFIACALKARADYLVTGNHRHFPAARMGEIAVIGARQLVDILSTVS